MIKEGVEIMGNKLFKPLLLGPVIPGDGEDEYGSMTHPNEPNTVFNSPSGYYQDAPGDVDVTIGGSDDIFE